MHYLDYIFASGMGNRIPANFLLSFLCEGLKGLYLNFLQRWKSGYLRLQGIWITEISRLLPYHRCYHRRQRICAWSHHIAGSHIRLDINDNHGRNERDGTALGVVILHCLGGAEAVSLPPPESFACADLLASQSLRF